MLDLPAYSKEIKRIRSHLKLSQHRFGKRLGVSGKSISAYECGRVEPSLRLFEKIANVYKCFLSEGVYPVSLRNEGNEVLPTTSSLSDISTMTELQKSKQDDVKAKYSSSSTSVSKVNTIEEVQISNVCLDDIKAIMQHLLSIIDKLDKYKA